MPLVDLNDQEPSDAPQALDWPTYRALVEREYAKLISNPANPESASQKFMENHPSMLSVQKRRHASWPHMAVTQPALQGFLKRQPDFMLVEENSGQLRAVLIEIETPSRRWAKEDGGQHHDLTHALDQMAEWRIWFSNPHNEANFQRHYHLDTREDFGQRYMLVHGSRVEATQHEVFARRRRLMDGVDQEVMSFDRLSPDANQANFVTARRIPEHAADQPKYELAGIPACFRFDVLSPDLCANVRLKPDVVRQAPFMPPERAEFIISLWETAALKAHPHRVLGAHRRF